MQEGDDEEDLVRVFVNNQNTRAATVTIPTIPKRRSSRRGDGFFLGGKPGTRDAGGMTTAGRSSGTADEVATGYNRKNGSHTRGSLKAPASIVQDDVHPHLEDVYQRVMRRLQRRANYEEVRCPSLAVQFGLVDPTEDEKSRERLEWDLDEHHTSAMSTSSSTTLGKSSIARRRHLHQQQHGGKDTSRGFVLSKNDDVVDDAGFLSQQPCPQTLRLVLEQVTSIVTEKLRIADVGSLKDCLRQVFESRTLLDRLIKEIPTYAQFHGDGERLPTAMQLHELYQEFRQKPMVLPSASYVRDPVSGRVTATVVEAGDETHNSAKTRSGSDTKQKQEEEQEQQEQEEENIASDPVARSHSVREESVSSSDKSHPAVSNVRKVTLVGGSSLAIPASYAKSSRTRQNAGRPYSVSRTTGGGTSTRLTFSHDGSSAERGEDGVQTSMREKHAELSRSDATASTSALTASNVNTNMMSPSSLRPDGTASAPMQTVPPTERWRQATQLVSVGVLTDINNTTVVSREEYEKLLAYSQKLEVDIDERRQELVQLTKELNEEKAYTSQKKKVVQYLRETLYKECSVLRSQLSIAQQKQIQYQALIKEQQQQQQQQQQAMAFAAGASVYESSRLPTITALRQQASEASAMMVSVSPGLFAARRVNPNLSVFNATRPSTYTEDHNETSHSMLAGASVYLGNITPPLTQQQQQQISVDITAIQSLLDLVLLAVEKDQMVPVGLSKAKKANMNIIANAMVDDPHLREQKLREEFAERHQQIKQSYTLNHVHTASMLAAKDEQIKYLKKFSDVLFLRRFWEEKGELLRNELRCLRRGVLDELENLKHFVITTMESIAGRARVVDTTLRDNHSLYSTQSALRDIISSAHSLLLPMMTTEYARGYHPWPLKLRNTMDPFSHMVKARHGDGQLLLIRDELNSLSDIYVVLHHYVMKKEILLQVKRPTPGKALEQLCGSLVLNRAANSEIWIQVREKYAHERALQKRIAELNTSIVRLVYRQRVLVERSTEAVREAGMDPRLISIPAQRTVNKIAEDVRKVVAERAQLRKQRHDNARDVFRLWRSKQIDVNEGYPPPAIPPRLVLGDVDVCRQNLRSELPLSGGGRMRMGSDSLPRGSIIHGQATSFWERLLSVSEGEKTGIETNETALPKAEGSR